MQILVTSAFHMQFNLLLLLDQLSTCACRCSVTFVERDYRENGTRYRWYLHVTGPFHPNHLQTGNDKKKDESELVLYIHWSQSVVIRLSPNIRSNAYLYTQFRMQRVRTASISPILNGPHFPGQRIIQPCEMRLWSILNILAASNKINSFQGQVQR